MSVKAFGDSVGFLPTQESFFYEGIKGVEDKVKPGEHSGIRSYYWVTTLFLKLLNVNFVVTRDVSGKVHYFSRTSLENFLKRHGIEKNLSALKNFELENHLQQVVWSVKQEFLDLATCQHNLLDALTIVELCPKSPTAEEFRQKIPGYKSQIIEIEKNLGLRK